MKEVSNALEKLELLKKNEKQPEDLIYQVKIEHLISIIERQIAIIDELESELKSLNNYIETITDWRNFVQ